MIKIGLIGYGNLGKGVEAAIEKNNDMELVAVFTRRDPESLIIQNENAKVLHITKAEKYINEIDVMVLCGGSATDLPEQGPKFATMFNTVDSFDTHAKIPEYFSSVDKEASANNHVSLISVGWDPGLFSMNRMLSEAVLPEGQAYTFWGKGVSQGHSDAIRRIKGVKDAKQYTIPIEEAINKVRNGEYPELSTREKHLRDCYVVVEDGADKDKIEQEIKTMPNYFSDYETKVTFITQEELDKEHSKMPHGGFVIRSGKTGFNNENDHIVEFSLKLDSNPQFTGSVLAAYARAVYKMVQQGDKGAKTVFDVPLSYLSPKTPEELRKHLL